MNEQSFPCDLEPSTSKHPGMTLRDYFAAKAMQGLMSDFKLRLVDEPFAALASFAYECADAMLKARDE